MTEVIELSQTRPAPLGSSGDEPARRAERRAAALPVDLERRSAAPAPGVAVAAAPAAPDPGRAASGQDPQLAQQLTQRVLEELQRQIDLMLEYRLREAIAPVLARVADNLVRDVRTELASTLRDVVARAVDEELARHREASFER